MLPCVATNNWSDAVIQPVFLDDTSFWDVVLWLVWVFFFTLAIWVFIAIFSDIFRRHDLSGWAKAGWTFLIFVLPFIGILAYLIVRPKSLPTTDDWVFGAPPAGASSPTDEIAKAHDLLQKGALTQEEFDAIKAKNLA